MDAACAPPWLTRRL